MCVCIITIINYENPSGTIHNIIVIEYAHTYLIIIIYNFVLARLFMTVDFNVHLIIYFNFGGTKCVHVYLVSNIIIMFLIFIRITFKGTMNRPLNDPVQSGRTRLVKLYNHKIW